MLLTILRFRRVKCTHVNSDARIYWWSLIYWSNPVTWLTRVKPVINCVTDLKTKRFTMQWDCIINEYLSSNNITPKSEYSYVLTDVKLIRTIKANDTCKFRLSASNKMAVASYSQQRPISVIIL